MNHTVGLTFPTDLIAQELLKVTFISVVKVTSSHKIKHS